MNPTAEERARELRDAECPGLSHGNQVSMFDTLDAVDCWQCLAEAISRIYDDGRRDAGPPECIHCGSRDVTVTHWERCSSHPAHAAIAKARDDGRREGLEEAAQLAEVHLMDPSWFVARLRALAEKGRGT